MEQGTSQSAAALAEVINNNRNALVDEWLASIKGHIRPHRGLSENDLREECGEFLTLLSEGAQNDGNLERVQTFLVNLSRQRNQQGFTPSETANFIFALKRPLFDRLTRANSKSALAHIIAASELLDGLGLMTTESFQKAREEVINRQQQEMLELSTPVVKLWHGILALPLIGTLDSARTQIVMEQLLERIVETGSDVAIIDITGVPMVDTLVAQHLIKTVTAARLMGADCIISGIRPQIAQTIVHLGVQLGDVTTKSNLADAFAVALARRNYVVMRKSAAPSGPK